MRFHLVIFFCLLTSPAFATTYYVSPAGDDTGPGTSPNQAWRSASKVGKTPFRQGDTILFKRGGEWREQLIASSNGSPTAPITYDAYGSGPKPKFLGSEILPNRLFKPAGAGKYSIKINYQPDTALRDHQFISASWLNGELIITSPTDPKTDRKDYTACVRGNVLFSNRKSHLIFRNLIVDETAAELDDGAVQGYGFRIEGSTNVTVDSCEAYRCGRHHFAAINSTQFVGKHLVAAFAQPNTPGGNSFYVSYADINAPERWCTNTWDDITATHIEDGNGGEYPMLDTHGDHLGLVTLKNVNATGKVSFMSAPVEVHGGTLHQNASIENFSDGALIDGVTLLDSSAIDNWASKSIIQNCIANLTGAGNGPTGYKAAIVIRDKAKMNSILFNTLASGAFAPAMLVGNDSATFFAGNIFFCDKFPINKVNGLVTPADVRGCDYNFYTMTSTGGAFRKKWRDQNFDANSKTGDPMFVDAKKGNFTLKPASPARGAAAGSSSIPKTDAVGNARNADAGAYQYVGQ